MSVHDQESVIEMATIAPIVNNSSSAARNEPVGFITPRYDDEISRTRNVKSTELTELVTKCDTLLSTLIYASQGEEIAWDLELSRGLFQSWKARMVELSLSTSMGDWVIGALGELTSWLTNLERLILQGVESDIPNEENDFVRNKYTCETEKETETEEYVSARKCAGMAVMCHIAIGYGSRNPNHPWRQHVRQIDHGIITLQHRICGRGRVYVMRNKKKAERKEKKKAKKGEMKAKLDKLFITRVALYPTRLARHLLTR